MARQVVINIDDDDWTTEDIASELVEVAHTIGDYGSHEGITNFGNSWSIEELEVL